MASTDNLAVRYRPKTMSEVAGQSSAVLVLKAAASSYSPPSQLLLAGPSGTGKTTLARLFAAALFCSDQNSGDACGVCGSCVQVITNSHPDVVEIDAASHGGIDQIRQLETTSNLTPMIAKWRVHIIDEAHGLTKDGASAFLRLLEEPPPGTVWILATTDPAKLPIAVRSRCLSLPITTPSRFEQVNNLARIASAEGWSFSNDLLETVVDTTDPDLGVRGTITTLSTLAAFAETSGVVDSQLAGQVLAVASKSEVANWFRFVHAGNVSAASLWVERICESKPAPTIATQLLATARQLFKEEVDADRDASRQLHVWRVLAEAPATVTGLSLAAIYAAELYENDPVVDAVSESEKPTIQEPTIQEPTIQEPTIQEPTIQEPTIQEHTPEGNTQTTDQNPYEDVYSLAEPPEDVYEDSYENPATFSKKRPIPETKTPTPKKTPTKRPPLPPPPTPIKQTTLQPINTTPHTLTPSELNKIATRNTKAALLAKACQITTDGTQLWIQPPEGTDKYLLAALLGILNETGQKATITQN